MTNSNENNTELDPIDAMHEEIREWIEEQGFKPESLDELIYSHHMVKSFMTDKQALEADVLMKRFDELEN